MNSPHDRTAVLDGLSTSGAGSATAPDGQGRNIRNGAPGGAPGRVGHPAAPFATGRPGPWLVAAALALTLLLPACQSPRDPVPGPARIRGRIVADRVPPDATVELYRHDGDGPPVPVVGNFDRVSDNGSFSTQPVLPGRYVVVVRTRENPPSTATAEVPGRAEIEMRLVSPGAGATVVLESPTSAAGVRTCRITPEQAGRGVPDRREVVLAPGGQARIAGLAPGVWRLDVMPDGATADFVVAAGEASQRWIVEPPAFPATGGSIGGTVLRPTGAPAHGTVVTVRWADSRGDSVRPWGRFGVVDRDGRYFVDRIEPGAAYVRVEGRDASYVELPPPELIRISPSPRAERGFRVGP